MQYAHCVKKVLPVYGAELNPKDYLNWKLDIRQTSEKCFTSSSIVNWELFRKNNLMCSLATDLVPLWPNIESNKLWLKSLCNMRMAYGKQCDTLTATVVALWQNVKKIF